MHPLFYLATLLTAATANAQTDGRIAFQTFRDGNWEIYLMDTLGGGPINLTDTSYWEMRPAFSPNGRHIAFESNRSGQFELYDLDIASGELRQLTDTPGNGHVAFAPDGRRIAFESDRGGS